VKKSVKSTKINLAKVYILIRLSSHVRIFQVKKSAIEPNQDTGLFYKKNVYAFPNK